MNAIVSTSVPALVAGSVTVSEPDFGKVKAQDFGKYAMREILKGLRVTERGNRSNVMLHVAQNVEAIARIMRSDAATGKDSIGTITGTKAVPPGVERIMRATFREVVVAMVKAGDAPYTDCNAAVAFVRSLPRETEQQRRLWDYQARRIADATLFLNGEIVEKPASGFLPESMKDAAPKQLVESLKVLKSNTNKVIAWLWATNAGVFRTYAFRDETGEKFSPLSAEDVSNVATIVSEKAGATMGDMVRAFAKPKASNDESPVAKLLKSFAKLSPEDRTAFLREANDAHSSLLAEATAAAAAVSPESDIDTFDDLDSDNDATAIAA